MSASWATKRKVTYAAGVVIFLLLFIGLPLFLKLYKPPTCSDGIQNQGEYGVDCGGPCPKLCSSQFLSPLVVWSRAIEVTHGVYNLLAYIENPNLSGETLYAPYHFKLYDDRGVLIGERTGTSFILPHSISPVFEGDFIAGTRLPESVTFDFDQPLPWQKVDYHDAGLVVTNKVLSQNQHGSRVDATIENRTTTAVGRVEVTAIVYDTDDNALAFSKTYVDSIGDNQSAQVAFTWPENFPTKAGKIEIIPLVDPRQRP